MMCVRAQERRSIAIVTLADPLVEHHFRCASRLLRSVSRVSFRSADIDLHLAVLGDAFTDVGNVPSTTKVHPLKVAVPRHRPSAKFLVGSIVDWSKFEFVCLLDIDTLVLRDFTQSLHTDHIHLKPADVATVPSSVIKDIAARFGFGCPLPFIRTTVSRSVLPFYVNSGVIICPGSLMQVVTGALLELAIKIHEYLKQKRPHYPTFADQLAITAMAAQGRLPPLRLLGNRLNFPLHLLPFSRMNGIDILHYHSEKVLRMRDDMMGHFEP
jgi:hypothetical protein